jgi:hypothetical protein
MKAIRFGQVFDGTSQCLLPINAGSKYFYTRPVYSSFPWLIST